jgi:transposase
MEVVNERCCGVDVHQLTVVACVIVPGTGRQPRKEIRTFGTMTPIYSCCRLAQRVWRDARGHGINRCVRKAPWNLLEGKFELLLVNAQLVKQVSGRKTDVKGCEWLTKLQRHGLLRASFCPGPSAGRAAGELRELTRYRTTRVRERAAETNRLQKTLEGANIKLGDVATDVVGLSGRDIMRAFGRWRTGRQLAG